MKTVFLILSVAVALAHAQFKLPSGIQIPTSLSDISNIIANVNVTKTVAEFKKMTSIERLSHFRKNCVTDFFTNLLDTQVLSNIDENLAQEEVKPKTDGSVFGFNCMSAISRSSLLETLKTKPSTEAINNRPVVQERKRRQATTLPASVDWRTKGYVTPVQNQGQCGSCWTFSANGAMEGAVFKKTGKLINLSEQNLVDCVTASSGCNGGWMTDAYDYSTKNLGTNNETIYPYLAKQNTACKNVATANTGKVASYAYTNQDDEADLKSKLATVGPIAIAIDASNIQNYVSGVYTCTNFTAVNHGVLVVGYGTDTTVTPNKDYYIVKNSWGTGWGEQGYIRIIRGQGAAASCGIPTYANYPIA